MPLVAADANADIDTSMNAMLLLSSSCQAVIEAEIQQVQSDWYQQLDAALGDAENLVLGWRRSGVLYFNTDILGTIGSAGASFTGAQPAIDALFASLNTQFTAAGQAQLVAALQALQPPVQSIVGQIDGYLEKLKAFETALQTPQQNMQTIVAQVQQQEQQLQATISSINTQIASLNTQVVADRNAIASAKSKRTSGIVETIFGVVLAPFTGGLSLVLAGIGVATLSAAEGLISAMESEISNYQQTIAGDQSQLTQDQRIVATLQGLTMSTGLVLNDLGLIESALDSLRTGWTVLDGELEGVVEKVQSAASPDALVVSKAWYDAACAEWALVTAHVSDLLNSSLSTSRVTIG